MKIEDDDGDEFCHSFCFCCLIRMDLINFLDVLLASLLVGGIAVVLHWEIHSSAVGSEEGRKSIRICKQKSVEMKAITFSDPCSDSSGAGAGITSHSSVGGTTQRNECLSKTS